MKQYVLDRMEPIPWSGCWAWLLSAGSHGYGNAFVRGVVQVAHRVSYEAFRGPVPSGAFVLHTCNVKLCVNPDHLYLGDHVQNMDDVARGKYHPGRKLESADVQAIRDSTDTQRELAERFGVSQRAVWGALHGRTYRYD